MCGDLDEDGPIGRELLARLQVMANRAGARRGEERRGPLPDLTATDGRATYMQALFSEGLARALADSEAVEDDQRIEAIASQAIALSRLAGFIAAQLPPEADLFRACIEAFSDGHAEPRRIAEAERARHVREHGHDHHHGHGHGHGHDHEHGHHHHGPGEDSDGATDGRPAVAHG